jgi:hypothetical protein
MVLEFPFSFMNLLTTEKGTGLEESSANIIANMLTTNKSITHLKLYGTTLFNRDGEGRKRGRTRDQTAEEGGGEGVITNFTAGTSIVISLLFWM